MKSDFLFGVWPYVATLILLSGMSVRVLLMRSSSDIGETTKLASCVPLAARLTWYASILGLVLLHLVQLVAPWSIALWNVAPLRLYLLEGVAFLFGLVTLIGFVIVVWRALYRRSLTSAAGHLADLACFSMLFAGLVSGLLMAVLYRWSSAWGGTTLMPYLLSAFKGDPLVMLVTGMPFLVRLHVVSAFAALAVFPFTQMASRASVVLCAALSLVTTPASGFANTCRCTGERWLQRPTVWIFQDEEE